MKNSRVLLTAVVFATGLVSVGMAGDSVFASADANKDNVLSEEEYLGIWRATDVDPNKDKDNDGAMSPDEWGGDDVSFKNFDLDADGVITKDEAEEKRKSQFVGLDKNQDGSLDIAEFESK